MSYKNKFPPRRPDNSHIIKIAPKLNWSKFQKDIFRNVANGIGNTAIIARAGSSKTTVLVESLKYVPKGKKILVAAFNKSIAEELKQRVRHNVDCSTLHSLGYRAILQRFGKVILDENKCFNIVSNLIGKDDFDLTKEIVKTVSLCKSTLTDIPSKILLLMDKYDIEIGSFTREKFAELIVKILAECKKQTSVIDYNDMIYFTFVYGLNIGKWDYIFIDEAQDMSYAQLVMALSAAKKESRIFVFLDDFQAIYGFNGCDIESVNLILEKIQATKLSLPISYRCPRKVVELAKEIVPDIQSTEFAIEGIVENIQVVDLLNKIKPGDFVLSRTNAPLIKHCLAALKVGIPANIQGRDVGANLLFFIKKSKTTSINEFIKYVNQWRNQEVERLSLEKKDPITYLDKAECLLNLCEGISSIKELKETIIKLFDDIDDNKKVIFSTTHKAKGLERDRVFILINTYRYAPGVIGEEANIYYVALTRSKKELFFVRTPSKYSKFDDSKK